MSSVESGFKTFCDGCIKSLINLNKKLAAARASKDWGPIDGLVKKEIMDRIAFMKEYSTKNYNKFIEDGAPVIAGVFRKYSDTYLENLNSIKEAISRLNDLKQWSMLSDLIAGIENMIADWKKTKMQIGNNP